MKSSRSKVAILLLVAPSALLILSFILFELVGLTFDPNFLPDPDGLESSPTPPAVLVINAVLLGVAAIGLVAWLPGLISGIVILAKRRK